MPKAMPKRKAARGKRGGGSSGRKAAQIATAKNDEAEMKIDLISGQETAVDLEPDAADEYPEVTDEDPGTEQAVDEGPGTEQAVDEDPGTEQAVDEDPGTEQAVDEGPGTVQAVDEGPGTVQAIDQAPSLDQDVTKCVLEIETISELKKNVSMEEEKCNYELNQENPGESVKTIDEKYEHLEVLQETSPSKDALEFESNAKSLENESLLAVKETHDSQEEECPLTEMQEEEMLGAVVNAGNNEGNSSELFFVDKEVESDQKEVEEVQYIDEEACEDQQLLDIMESLSNPTTIINSEPHKENDREKQSENPELSEDCEVSAEHIKSSADESQKNEDIDNSKFEEISEGSIDQDHEELTVEAISDIEISGQTFMPKKAENIKNINVQKGQTSVRYKEAESLEEVFFATENDDAKITAEDKDNDDISDASLSDHVDANLSLEEISDDDLEPSKKKRKPTGMTPIKTEKIDENTKMDAENVNKLEEKSEGVKTNQTSATNTKRPTTDNIGGSERNSSKRFKSSNEAKISEETSRGENDSSLFTSGDLKKEGNKLKSKETEVSHGRNVFNKRNPSHSTKIEQPENRERSLPSRDVAEHRRRFELVSSSCQTEPRLLKGKIVQCNINPIKSTIEPGRFEIHSEGAITVTKLLNKFRKQLPSSIPEKIFSEVTSLQPPHKANTFSFSMGPVTLSDMDCPKFRDVLRGAEELNLAFDRQCQGMLKASVATHESLASLISRLKLLELGNRYMVMSVVYKYGSEMSVGVWKATIMFMYEQDIQMESQSLVRDGKVRAKLCLKWVPSRVSKDFIHLLFPEAINISTGTGPGTFEERDVVLGFSNTKMVEKILSCYDLLIICGSQISISAINSSETQQNITADIHVESADVIQEDTKLSGEVSEQPEICITLEPEKDISKQQYELVLHLDSTTQNETEDSRHNDSKQDQIKQDYCKSDPETDGLARDMVDVLDHGNNVLTTEGKDTLLSATNSCKEAAQFPAETSVTDETVCTSDPFELADINTSNNQDPITTKPTDEKLTSKSKDKNELDDSEVICLDDDDDNSMNSQKTDINKPSESLLCDTANILNIEIKGEISKPEAIMQDNSINSTAAKVELLKSTETPTEGDTPLEDVNKDSAKGNTIEVSREDENSETKVHILKKEASKETNDENLEDVSDEEMINQSKNEDHEDVVILKEDSTQWVAANIDLTNEESNASGKIVNESTKDLTEENNQQLKSPAKKINDSIGKATSGNNDGNNDGKNFDRKLVMTDGGLEVSMEVIDVNECNQEVDKVIYARTWRQSRDRSRERNRWDPGNFKATPYGHMPWRDNQWSYSSKQDAYNSQNPYKYYPAKEDVSRIPKHYSGSSHEGSPNYRVPAREETAHRRNSYSTKYRRNLSPSPKRDQNFQGHSSSHAPDHRASITNHWDKRYYNWRPSTYGDSRKTESYSRPAAEPSGRPAYVQSHSTAYHSSHAWRDSQYDSAKTGDRYSHNNSRGTHYRDRRHDYRRTRSRSYSDMSISSGDRLSPVRKSSYRRESPKRSGQHASRSPITVSSRSRSLSPVSKSPSIEYSQAGAGKEELVKTVKHFLELAKGLQQAQKRRSNRSRSPKSPSLRRSKSPLPVRPSSPHTSSSHARKAGRSSRHAELLSPPRIRSKSPLPSWSKNSRSPSYTRTHKYKHERSPSPSSPSSNYKRHRGDRSYNDRKGKSYRRESESPRRRYEPKKSQRTGDSSKPYEEQGSRSKSGQSSDPKYRSSGDQSWQQSSSGYQPPQSSGQSSTSNIYNPAYPPPGMYSGNSVPVYNYNNPSQYNYSSIPPPYVQSVPPPPVGQSYQSSSYSVYQPSQPYTTSGHHNAPLQTSSTGGASSNNTSSKSKKSWSMGASAMAFQRVLGSSKGDKKGKSGVIEKVEDRERLERPKYTKQERVLATVQMEKK